MIYTSQDFSDSGLPKTASFALIGPIVAALLALEEPLT